MIFFTFLYTVAMLSTSHNTNKYQSIERKKINFNLFFKKSIVSKAVRVESMIRKKWTQ